ncbi:MAG TPA: DUF2934 domain-containing protein [Candidatus Binataceae bacterium]|nr:DUF2934 domain-containing protein [Candidatus Binataceae bacterium]
MSDFAQRIRERAYQIWQSKGCPDGEAEQHWCQAERELSTSNDEELRGAHDYERNLQKFERNGHAGSAAQEAKRAVEGPEGQSLREAEEKGKQRSKGEDL